MPFPAALLSAPFGGDGVVGMALVYGLVLRMHRFVTMAGLASDDTCAVICCSERWHIFSADTHVAGTAQLTVPTWFKVI